MQSVSVIIPCFNEEKRILSVLKALSEQTYPKIFLEIVIADGHSSDNTVSLIQDFIRENPELKIAIINNLRRNIPAGLNIGMQASHGDIIIRMDAHSKPHKDYIEKCVSALENGIADNVGGIWEIHPGENTWTAKSIAVAATLPIAVGDALYRHTNKPSYVETVPFGAFKRELLAIIGFFNEDLLANEDYEFNTRITLNGGKIWLDPGIRSIYYARSTFRELSKQYWRYGYWKWKMLQIYPKTIRWRQALPPLFVSSLLVLSVLSIFINWLWIVPTMEIIIYFMVIGGVGFAHSIRDRKLEYLVGIPTAISIMHISWGSGFLWSMIKGIFKK